MDENFKSLAILPLGRYGKLNNLDEFFLNGDISFQILFREVEQWVRWKCGW